jgi:hypothetical protein
LFLSHDLLVRKTIWSLPGMGNGFSIQSMTSKKTSLQSERLVSIEVYGNINSA